MAGERFLTVDHERIREWVEERAGWPAAAGSDWDGENAEALRIAFPAGPGAGALERVSWRQWFRAFDEAGLVLLHGESAAGESQGREHRLVSRATAREAARGGAVWVGRDRGEPPEGRREGEVPAPRVDINHASADELDRLFGIGPESARKIIRFRNNNGRIRELDELLDVEGIDGATLQGMRRLVRTE